MHVFNTHTFLMIFIFANAGERFDSLSPAEGPASGGNYVTITGSGFQATRSYVCSFRDLANSSRSVNFSAVYDESTEIRCVMGLWPFPEAITRLELRNNGTLVNSTRGPYNYNFKGVYLSTSFVAMSCLPTAHVWKRKSVCCM